MKKLTALFLALLMILSVFSFAAVAEEEEKVVAVEEHPETTEATTEEETVEVAVTDNEAEEATEVEAVE